MPRLDKLRRMKNNLGELIKEANTKNWNRITELICQHWGDPKTFWRKYKELKGNKSKPPKYLILIFGDPSIIEPDQIDHNNKQLIYTNPEKQAEVMSKVWSSIFHKNTGRKYAKN